MSIVFMYEMSYFSLLVAFQLFLKPQCLKKHANDTFLWPSSKATSCEHVTTIEAIVQNLYRWTNFYQVIVSTGISATSMSGVKMHLFDLITSCCLYLVVMWISNVASLTTCHWISSKGCPIYLNILNVWAPAARLELMQYTVTSCLYTHVTINYS